MPYVFTENGVAMLSSILRSQRAIHVNIHIMRAFTKLREWLATHRDLQEKIRKLERKFDRKFAIVFQAIQQLLKEHQNRGCAMRSMLSCLWRRSSSPMRRSRSPNERNEP